MSFPRRKYRNVPTTHNGIRYASKAEAAYAADLDLAQRAGSVLWWIRQPRFDLPGGVVYVADFLVHRVMSGVTIVAACIRCTSGASFASSATRSLPSQLPSPATAGTEYHTGAALVEAIDVKGVFTAAFKIKAKLFRATYPHLPLRVVKRKGKRFVDAEARKAKEPT